MKSSILILAFVVTSSSLFINTALAAPPAAKVTKTVVQERASQMVQTVRLDRLTFGPDDNFQPAPFSDGRTLLFTRKAHMNPILEILDISKRELSSWRSNLRDVDQASVHPQTGQVVFRSLERSPDGEICTTTAMSETITCLKLLNGEKSSPFWIAKNKIGYVRKDRSSSNVSLEFYNIETERSATLTTSKLFHPSASFDGRRLAWVEKLSRQGNSQKIQYAELKGDTLGELCSPRLSWPGLSAYPRFSADGQFLIFSHYLSDSNHDGRIDGEDDSILARMALPAQGCATDVSFPEPLTALTENCSQPGISGHQMVVACAFEGSLDLYSLPETGVIPTSWSEADLLSAHGSARTPEDRLLFLLALAAKNRQGAKPSIAALLRGIFAQTLLMDDEAGALEWLAEMKIRNSDLSAAEVAAFDKILKLSINRRSEPSGEISINLRQSLQDVLRTMSGEQFLVTVGRGRVHRLISAPGSLAKAKAELEKAAGRKSESELSLLFFSHEWDLLSQATELNEELYQNNLSKLTSLSEPSQLIYWAKSLQRMEKSKRRSEILNKWSNAKLPDTILQLIKLEILASDVQAGKKDAYLAYDKLLTAQREKLLLVRMAAYRAIRLWSQSDKLEEVGFITTNLFKYVPPNSLESTYAKDYFIATSFDRGYEYIRLKQPAAALGHFYSAVMMTDSLEAHWGYLTQMMAAGRENLIERNIQDLKKRNVIRETEPLMRLYAELARRKGELPEQPEEWLAAVKKAEPAPDAFASFLRGSVRLQRILETPSMKEDELRSELDLARLELILAMDGARDNLRLKAQAQTNLGILGMKAKLWGAAQKWWQERLEIPFEDEDSRNLASFLRAQALLGLQDFHQASEILNDLKISKDSYLVAPIHHLRIQAAAFAGQHEKVLEISKARPNPLKGLNDLKLGLLQGRSLIQLNKNKEACDILTQVNTSLGTIPNLQGGGQPSGKDPRRLKIIAAGFLSRCENGTTASRARLEKHQQLMALSLDERKALAFYEASFLEARMKTQIRLWLLSGDLSSESITSFMTDLDAHRVESGQIVNLGQFEALYALGSLSLTSKTTLTPEQSLEIKSRMDSFLNSSRRSLARSDLLTSQRIKLEALRWKMDQVSAADFDKRLQASGDLKELDERNKFLAGKVREALDWMRAAR